MPIAGIDHVALPTDRPEAMLAFYAKLGFRVQPTLEEWRETRLPFFSVFVGPNRLNFHTPDLWQKTDFALRGPTATPGCGDLCFVWEGGQEALAGHLRAAGIEVETGPVALEGGRGPGTSVYLRDPDRNLLEFIVYDAQAS